MMAGIPVTLTGVSHSDSNGILEQSMHKKEMLVGKGLLPGAIVYTEPFKNYVSENIFFLNPTLGVAMNQNITFSGSAELIFDGGSGGTEWTGTGPAQWDFSDGGKVTVDHGPNNSQALFSDSGTTNTSNYTALTGKVDLDNYSPATQKLVIQFRLAGLALGNSVNLDDYINTTDFSEQSFVVPIADFGLAGVTVDEFTITINRTGGHNPHVSFDDFQLEAVGEPIVFTAQPNPDERFNVSELRIVIAAATSSITTVSGDTQNATMANLSFDDFIGLTLGTGWTLQRTTNSVSGFAATIRDLGDTLLAGANIENLISDGTNTHVVLCVPFPYGLLLDGAKKDKITITINDNMSSLLKFSATLIGGRELMQG